MTGVTLYASHETPATHSLPMGFVRAALPIGCLLSHAWLYGGWLIDDAGITFAYARNLVEGHGFVAQVGDVPVEGFTNLLWLLVVAATMALGVFDVVWTPKVLGLASASVALVLVHATARRNVPEPARTWIDAGAILTALNPAFVIWCSSGLENGLTALLIAILYRSLSRSEEVTSGSSAAVWTGVVATLLIANRPDGAVFAAAYPCWILLRGRLPIGRRAQLVACHVAVVALGLAALTTWRLQTFGDFVPNTFHAKGAGTERTALLAAVHAAALFALVIFGGRIFRRGLWLEIGWLITFVLLADSMRADSALRSVAGPLGIPLATLGAWLVARATPATRIDRAAWILLGLALLQFCALPKDWMPEYRFGTPLVLIGGVTIAGALGSRVHELGRWHRWASTIALGLALLITTKFVLRSREFLLQPTVPFDSTLTDFETRYLACTHALGLTPEVASVLTPDVGGPFWSRTLRVYDLAGLCDRESARLLADRGAMADRILATLRPTFISMHQSHAWSSGLHDDERFDRDYIGIHTHRDSWILETEAVEYLVGQFVRRDVLGESETSIEVLRDLARIVRH